MSQVGSVKSRFMSRATCSFDTVYQAVRDGFVIGYGGATNAYLDCYADGTAPPTGPVTKRFATRDYGGGNYAGVVMFVIKGEYWKVTESLPGTGALFWMALQ